MIKRATIFGTAIAVGASMFLFSGRASADDAMSKTDSKFVIDAAQGGMAEVKAGQLAAEKATDPDVKSFAQKMVEDHGKANDELKAAAEKKGIAVPMALDSSHEKMLQKLSKLIGADFDKQYVKDMISDHKDTIELFQKEADKGDDGDLKAWAGQTLPTLQMHLSMIQDIQKKMKGE